MNYEAERAMNQKRLRMDGEPGHGVVQGNGLPLNYMDNGHQIPYQPYAGAYNTHYPPPDAFAAYGPPPPGGYAPQNLSYAPPAHQNYPHHQSFPPQQQTQLHMPQTHMVQGYGDVGMHKAAAAAWAPQQHLLPPLDAQKTIDVKQLKPEIKVEPADTHKRQHHDQEMMGGDMDQPKIKIKTDIFKPDDVPQRPDIAKPQDGQPGPEIPAGDKPAALKTEATADAAADASRPVDPNATPEKKEGEVKSEAFGSPDRPKSSTTPGKLSPGGSEKKRGRPKGSTNKPKAATPTALKPVTPQTPGALGAARGPGAAGAARPSPMGRPRAAPYQYAVRPFRKDFSGIQFRRRWSDDCLDSSHIPNEVYFGDVPVSTEVLFNYYDANAERERLAAQAAQIAAQKAAAAKLAAAKLQARGIISHEVTTVDSSSSDDSSGSSGSGDSDSDDDAPLKKTPGKSKGPKSSKSPKTPTGGGRRGRPPVPPEQREPGITDMKKFCKAAGIRFDYKKLVEGCTKNKERVGKMMELLIAAGLEGKPTLDKCKALKQVKQQKKEEEKRVKKEAKVKKEEEPAGLEGKPTLDKCKALKQVKQQKKEEEKRVKKEAKVKKEEEPEEDSKTEGGGGGSSTRRVTRGQTGVKPRQKIVISSDEEDDTPDARRTLSKLRSMGDDESDSG